MEKAINLFLERMHKAATLAQDRLKAEGRQIGKWIPKHPRKHPEMNTRLAKRPEAKEEKRAKTESTQVDPFTKIAK